MEYLKAYTGRHSVSLQQVGKHLTATGADFIFLLLELMYSHIITSYCFCVQKPLVCQRIVLFIGVIRQVTQKLKHY